MQDTPRSITELKRQRGLLPPLPGSISAKKAERGIPFSPAPVSSGKWLLQKNVQDALMEPDNAMGRTMVPTAEGPQLLSGMAEQYTQELNRNVGQHGQTWPMQSSVTTLSPRPSGQEPAPSIIYDATQAYSDPGFWDQISQKSPEMAAFWKSAQEQYGKDAPTVMQELATQESQRSIEEWRKQNPKKSILEHTGSMLQFFTAAGAVKGVGTAVGKKVLSKAAQEAVAKKSGSVLGRMAAGAGIGAAADASLQGGRVATGAQDEFSLAQVGSTAVGGAAGALAGSAVQGLSKLAGRSPVAAAMIRSLRTPAEFTAFQKASEAVGDAPPGDAHLSGWEKALKLAYDSALAGGYHRVTGRSPLALPEPGQSKASQRIIEGMKGPGAATTAAPELARVKAGQYVETPTGPQKVRVVGEHTVQPERGPPIPAKDVRVVPDPTPQPQPTPKPVAAPKPKPKPKKPTPAPNPAPAKQPSEAVQAVRDAISGKKKITWDEVRRLHREADESTRLKIRSAVESGNLNPTNSGRPKNRAQAVRQLSNDVYPERVSSKKPKPAPAKPQVEAPVVELPPVGSAPKPFDTTAMQAQEGVPLETYEHRRRPTYKRLPSGKEVLVQDKDHVDRQIRVKTDPDFALMGEGWMIVKDVTRSGKVEPMWSVEGPENLSMRREVTARFKTAEQAMEFLARLEFHSSQARKAGGKTTEGHVKQALKDVAVTQEQPTAAPKPQPAPKKATAKPKPAPAKKPKPITGGERNLLDHEMSRAIRSNPEQHKRIHELAERFRGGDREALKEIMGIRGGEGTAAKPKPKPAPAKKPKSEIQKGHTLSDRDPATMTPAEVNRELASLEKKSSALTTEFIEAGRGHERPSDRRGKTDELTLRERVLNDRITALRDEIRTRAGPSANKMPPGFKRRKPAPAKSEIQKAADEIRDLRKDRPGEAGALDTDVLVAAAKRAGKALLAVMDAPRRSAGAVAGVGKQGKEVYDRQRAVQAMKNAKRWLDQKSELSEMEAQDLRLDVEAGKVKVEEVRSPDWRTVEIKLSDGRLIRTIEDNPFSTHSKVGRGRPGKPGSKRPQGLDEGILLETDMVDVLSRRLPAAIDRAIEGAIGNRGMYRGLRRLMTEQDKNPALANLTEESRLMMREAHDKLRKIQWDVNRVLEKSTEADRPAILESLTFFHENLGPLPYRMVKDRADLRTLNEAVKLMRENFALMGRVWEGTGFLKTETVEQFQDPRIRGQGPGSTYAPRKYRNKPQVDKTTRESRAAMDALGMKSLLDPWAIQRISGTFKQRTLDLEESIRSGRITDYRSAMEEMGRQLHGAEKALTFKRIADDPLLSREADPAATLRKDLASAKVKERKLRTKMGQKGILVEAERTQKDEAAQSRARASWRRAHGAYDAEPGKETLKALKSAETRWIKTLRVPAGQKLEAYLDGLVTRKLDHTSPSFRSMNDALADAVRERIRLEHEASSEWVEMPDSAAMGPLRGMFVRREVADAIQEPLKRVMWWQAFKSIHAHAKKQATGRNPSVHVTNFVSNRFTLEGMGVDTLLPAYNRFEWMARRILRQQSETGKWEFSKKELAHLQKLGLDPQATRDQVQRYLDSGIYSNSQYAVEIGPDNVSLAKAKERYEARAESMGSKQAAVPTIEAIDLAIQGLDMTILESTGPLGKGIKRLQDAYSRADAAQGLAGFLALASGKGNSYGRAIPEQVALERMQSFLDFSKVPRLVQGVSQVWSFARIFYMLPRGVIRAITSPSGLARMLNKPAQASRAAATVQALGSALWRVGKFVAPIVTAHQVAQTRWGLSDEEYDDRMRGMGYGRGYRSLFAMPKFWEDTVGFIDLTKYLPHAQAGVWLLEAADTIRNIAKGKDLSDEFRAATTRKNILLSPIDEMYRGRGFYDQEQGFFEGLGRAASGLITPRVVKSVAEAVDRDTLTTRQRLLYPLGIRERDISEEKALDYWMRNEAEFDPDVEAREFMTITQTKRLERLRELALERRKGPLSEKKQAEQEKLEKSYREFQAKYRRKSQLSKQRRSEQD